MIITNEAEYHHAVHQVKFFDHGDWATDAQDRRCTDLWTAIEEYDKVYYPKAVEAEADPLPERQMVDSKCALCPSNFTQWVGSDGKLYCDRCKLIAHNLRATKGVTFTVKPRT